MNIYLNSKFLTIIYFAILYACVEVSAFYNLKKNNIPVALICYVFISFILLYAYDHINIGLMNIVTSVISIILSFFISYMYLGEKINKYTIIALIFALLAIYFAYISDE
jgi:drug/metabolite transporter (DMT)-like permease